MVEGGSLEWLESNRGGGHIHPLISGGILLRSYVSSFMAMVSGMVYQYETSLK